MLWIKVGQTPYFRHVLCVLLLKPLSLFLLFQTEKPERRHTFASLALRKRYSYLTDPAASEFTVSAYAIFYRYPSYMAHP